MDLRPTFAGRWITRRRTIAPVAAAVAIAALWGAQALIADPPGKKPSAGPGPAEPRQVAAPPAASTGGQSLDRQPRITRHAGDDWPAFLGSSGDSKSRETGVIAPWPDAGPRVVWTVELGEGYGPPAVSAGRLFMFDRVDNRARLRTLESETGRELWSFAYPTDYQDMYGYDGGPRASPVVDEDRVYVFGAEGMLFCLRVADGGVVWKRDTTAQFGVPQNFFGVGSTPVVFGELLIVQIGGSRAPREAAQAPGNGRSDGGQPDAGPPPGAGPLNRDEPVGPPADAAGAGSGVVAFDKRTGAVRYRITNELASYSSPHLATIADRPWCFVFARGGLICFDPASGKVDFEFPWRAPIVESVNASNPVVAGNLVFISETYGPGSALLRVRPGGYDVVWSDAQRRRDKAMQTHWNTPIERNGFLYGSSGRHEPNAELRCIELATGAVRWSQPDLRRASLLYVDGYFVCLSENGALRLLRVSPDKFDVVSEALLVEPPTGGRDLGSANRRLLKPPAWAAPILSHGLLYVRGRDRLVCVELIAAK